MKKHIAFAISSLFLILFSFCTFLQGADDTARSLDKSLKLAGKNRAELQTALKKCEQQELESKSIKFLIRHMPVRDLETLSADFLVENIRLAIKARNDNSWAKKVPEEVFLNDVLPYAAVNERRDNWRKDFYERFNPLVKNCKSTGEAAQELNKNVFALLKVKYSTKRKKPDQSPFESMESGLASCTGLSVILADACRAVGVPARLAGTPLWVNKRGNHTWVEVYDEGQWKFTGACEYDSKGLNRGWFKGIASQADPKDPRHRIYATSFRNTGQHFPMVWKRRSTEVPGVDVTWRYIGQPQKVGKGKFDVAFQLYDSNKKRVAGEISVFRKDMIVGSGKSRTESNDANDFFEIALSPGVYRVTYLSNGTKGESRITVRPEPNQIHRIEIKPSK